MAFKISALGSEQAGLPEATTDAYEENVSLDGQTRAPILCSTYYSRGCKQRGLGLGGEFQDVQFETHYFTRSRHLEYECT